MPKTQRSTAQRDAEAIRRIREILWPHDDPERQWTADTLNRVADGMNSVISTWLRPTTVASPRLNGGRRSELTGQTFEDDALDVFACVGCPGESCETCGGWGFYHDANQCS